jgi:acetyltransferase
MRAPAIRPYPSELESRADLRGSSVLLRPIRPDDARAYAEFIGRTEAPDLQFRFFSRPRRVSPAELARFTQVDYDSEMAFVAVSGESGSPEILGEARMMVSPDGDSAEFGILVRSDLKRRGIGRALLEKLIDYSRSRGKGSLIGQIDAANEAMIALARRCGMDVERVPDSKLAVAHLDLRHAGPHAART